MGENTLEFPFANLVELENRVFTDSWSIPYKKEESLGVCLIAATRLANESKAAMDGTIYSLELGTVSAMLK